MAEERRDGEEYEDQRRATGRESMRRRSPEKTRARGQKRGAPAKFNGIHRRRSKRSSSW